MLCEVHHTEVLDRLRTRAGSCENFLREELDSIPAASLADLTQARLHEIDIDDDSEASATVRLPEKLEEAFEGDTLRMDFERESGHWRMVHDGEPLF